LELFTQDAEVMRIGTLYLRTVAPFYALLGLGMALYFVMQGMGQVLPAVLSNAARLLISAGSALAAVYWLGAGPLGMFGAIACGFVLYAACNTYAFTRGHQ
jgi:Na+-driven multidrug efflux pump